MNLKVTKRNGTKELFDPEKINKILNITKTNKQFYIYDIESNEDKKKEIEDLKDDIGKYFCFSIKY
jgi:hypothetical protein